MAWYRTITFMAIGTAFTGSIAMAQEDWTQRFNLSGELAYRIQKDVNKQNKATTGTRTDFRHRIRAGLLIGAKLNDKLSAKIGLATGIMAASGPYAANDGARSPWMEETGFGSKKGFDIEQAAFDYKSGSANISLGRFLNPNWRPAFFQFHPGVAFEGANVGYKLDYDAVKPWINVGYSTLWGRYEENAAQAAPTSSTKGPDVSLFAAQLGTSWRIIEPLTVTAAVNAYNYNGMKGTTTAITSGTNAATATAFGNTVFTGNVYKYDYHLIGAAIEITYNLSFGPLGLFYEHVQNNDPDTENIAFNYGIKVGQLKDVGNWNVVVQSRKLEKDSMVAAHSEVNFLGGGTDQEGWAVSAGYQVMPRTSVIFQYLWGTKNLSTTSYEVNTTTLDLVARF